MKQLSTESGISLIELLIGAAVFALAVAGFFSVISDITRISKESVQAQRAYQTLETMLDSPRFASHSYAQLPAGDSVMIRDSSLLLVDAKGENLAALLTVSVFRVSYAGNGIDAIPAKKIRGILSWQQDDRQVERCTLETLIAMSAGVE